MTSAFHGALSRATGLQRERTGPLRRVIVKCADVMKDPDQMDGLCSAVSYICLYRYSAPESPLP